MTNLALKIRDMILAQSEPVALQTLLALGAKRGLDRHTMLSAIREVHKMKSIRTTERMGTIYYDTMPIHEVVAAPRVDRASYPVMDETNDCHHEIFEGMDYSQLFLTPEELRMLEWSEKNKREKDTRLFINSMVKDRESLIKDTQKMAQQTNI